MKNIRHILCLLLIPAALLSTSTHAEETVKKARWYQINLTFFQQKTDNSLDEAFSFNELTLNMSDAISLHTGQTYNLANSGMNAALLMHHENINNQAFSMQNIDESWSQTLNKLDPVTQPIIYNMQWVQPVYDKNNSLPIYFESSAQTLGQPQLKGLFELHVSRYLHSKIKLQFLSHKARQLNELISFEQSRRMRSKEVHYMDHPEVGTLLRILPVEHPLVTKEKEAEKKLNMRGKDINKYQSALNARI